jgi:hypothetical protein
MIWCFACRMRLAMCSRMNSRIDVSVLAVEYRAFVVAAPPYFVAGNRLSKYRGAVSVGASFAGVRRRQPNSYRGFEGVS